MDRFLRHHPEACAFEGTLQSMRDNVKGGAHAWVTLVCKDGRMFCLDTLNHIGGSLDNPTFTENLKNVFGDEAVNNQIAKGKHLHRKIYH